MRTFVSALLAATALAESPIQNSVATRSNFLSFDLLDRKTGSKLSLGDAPRKVRRGFTEAFKGDSHDLTLKRKDVRVKTNGCTRVTPHIKRFTTNRKNEGYGVGYSHCRHAFLVHIECRIASAAEADADKIKIQVIDPPQVPQNPVAPKRGLLITEEVLRHLVTKVERPVRAARQDAGTVQRPSRMCASYSARKCLMVDTTGAISASPNGQSVLPPMPLQTSSSRSMSFICPDTPGSMPTSFSSDPSCFICRNCSRKSSSRSSASEKARAPASAWPSRKAWPSRTAGRSA